MVVESTSPVVMALVDYASSGEDDELEVVEPSIAIAKSHSATTSKRKREDDTGNTLDLPPLPSRFHDLYASTTRISTRDNPDLHGGRKRAIPHIQGNWPSHIYIECMYALLSHMSSKPFS